MLLVNGVRLDLNDKTNPYVQEYYDWLDKFSREGYKFPLRIMTMMRPRMNITGDREPERRMALSWVANERKDNGIVEWRYVDRVGNEKHKSEPVGASIYVEEKDKAFFLLTKSNQFKQKHIWIEDKRAEAKTFLDSLARMVDVNWMLVSPKSPISGDDAKVREIAQAFRISKAAKEDGYSLDEVKATLVKQIELGETTKDPYVNISAFLEMVDMPNTVTRRAYIQRALDAKIIEYDPNRFCVNILVNGEVKEFVRVGAKDWLRKEEVFIDAMMKDPSRCKLFDDLVGVKFAGDTLSTADEVDNLSFDELKEKCNHAGITTVGPGRTKKQLTKELVEHLGLA